MISLILISPPADHPDEAEILHFLFESGLDTFHLRKPRCSEPQIHAYMEAIPYRYHSRIVLHSHWKLGSFYSLKGLHGRESLTWNKNHSAETRSLSCHSLEEVQTLSTSFDYFFLSPIFPSISKPGYSKSWDEEELKNCLLKTPKKSFALGGVTPQNLKKVEKLGFDGAALLGSIWNRGWDAVREWEAMHARV